MKKDFGPITIATSEQCAWRAVYVYVASRKVFYLGFDPANSRGPEVFGGSGIEKMFGRFLPFWSFRFRLPSIRWRYQMPEWQARLFQAQQRFLLSLDGRYRRPA